MAQIKCGPKQFISKVSNNWKSSNLNKNIQNYFLGQKGFIFYEF